MLKSVPKSVKQCKSGDFAFVTVKRNSFKSNTSQKFVILTAARIIFRIYSDLLAAKYAPRKNFEFLQHVFSCEFQPRENLEKTHFPKIGRYYVVKMQGFAKLHVVHF